MVKLADLGDALTATPALRALRQTWPEGVIDVLTTPAGAAALEGLDSIDRLWVTDKHRFDSPAGALALPALAPLLARLRHQRYDQLLLMHHLTTRFGTAKYALLTAAIGAGRTAGLDNGRGGFLDVRVPDAGFGARHEVDYALAIASTAGATAPASPRLEIALSSAARRRAAELLTAGSDGVATAKPGQARSGGLGSAAGAETPAQAQPISGADAGAEPLPVGSPAGFETRTQERPSSEADAGAEPPPVGSAAGGEMHVRGGSLPLAAETQPWIALHAGGGAYSTARRWPAESFLAAGRALAKRANLVLVGADADREPHELLARELGALDLTGRTTVKETAAVLARCQLLLSNDSGVVHLAAAVGTPVVAVFGPSNDLAWGPYPPAKHRVVRASLPCSPCFYRGTSLGTPEGCPTRDCLQLVTPDMVVEAVRSLLAQPAAA